jgi:hypothetical protein
MNYWEERYSSGLGSATGPVKQYHEWKWQTIERIIGKPQDVLDVGCGDLLFWDGHDCSKYSGLDISSTILEKDRISHPKWNFILASAADDLNVNAETVLCLDMLFHIMDDDTYLKIIQNLIKWTKKDLVIFTWISNPLRKKGLFGKSTEIQTDEKYQKYRDFSKYERIIVESGFKLHAKERIPFNEFGALWFFQRDRN